MLNSELKETSLARLKLSEAKYKKNRHNVQFYCKKLFDIRKATTSDIIKPVEDYINKLAKTPIELEKSVENLQVNYKTFAEVFKLQKGYSDQVNKVAANIEGSGIVIGAGVGALAPTAAMAVATTFGTASTGAAISGLSGAAATNAALAWLGGGSIAAGGGGMAAGNALLAMAGPIGWGIAGVAIIGGSWWKASKNKEIAEEVIKAAETYDKESATLSAVKEEVEGLYNLTIKHSEGIKVQLKYLQNNAPNNYAQFTDVNASEMAALINNINALSELLNKRIEA